MSLFSGANERKAAIDRAQKAEKNAVNAKKRDDSRSALREPTKTAQPDSSAKIAAKITNIIASCTQPPLNYCLSHYIESK